MGRDLSVAYRSEQVVEGGVGHFVRYLEQFIRFEDLRRAQFMLPQVLLKEFPAQQDASPPLLGLEPCLDSGLRFRSLDELEPVPARRMAGLGYDLDLVAVAQPV